MGTVVDSLFAAVRHFLIELLACILFSWLLNLGAAA